MTVIVIATIINEQIIPLEMKFSSIRQYNPRKLKKWGFKNLVYTRSSEFMYYFYIYDEKNNESVNNDYDN